MDSSSICHLSVTVIFTDNKDMFVHVTWPLGWVQKCWLQCVVVLCLVVEGYAGVSPVCVMAFILVPFVA